MTHHNDTSDNYATAVNSRQPLIGMTLEQLREVCAEVGAKPFAAKQLARWLYVARVTEIDAMTDLSKDVRVRLAARFIVGRESPLKSVTSVDGTVKYLFRGSQGRDIEAVYIPDGERATLCVSSQAGCRMGCKFCMTGRQGYHGNLTTAQIINQILSIDNSDSLTNLVFMGMGEPTDNLDAVIDAIEILTASWGFAWSPKRITVSSIGRLPEIERLLTQTKVHIAISVHSPFDVERASLMPSERAWPLHSIFESLKKYDWTGQRRLSVEYIMWRGLNDDLRHADALARLVRPTHARVNLIRFHDIGDTKLLPSSKAVMEAFRDRLNNLGVTATIRASRGEDIMAACGMLAGEAKCEDKTTNIK
ncbi:MAG: 23S rRNA (adenine(2503)-C(2))-methyltransferase RlmN [Muribaculaceae bacterium]|nr:23S rRNA (adenine(2503)-C(2))-methyltransferase RlmN [Muribaculaceae bacterium]